MRLTYGDNFVDPVTGLTVISGKIRVTQGGKIRIVQQTGEPDGGYNTQPGTDSTVPASLGGNNPGVPRGFTEVPKTGTLIVNGKIVEEP